MRDNHKANQQIYTVSLTRGELTALLTGCNCALSIKLPTYEQQCDIIDATAELKRQLHACDMRNKYLVTDPWDDDDP